MPRGNGVMQSSKISERIASSVLGQRKRVLLVENDSHARLVLFNQLKAAGLDVELAANGTIALKKLQEAQFHALILDMLLSGAKGLDVIKRAREAQKSSEFPIFVCTSAKRMGSWSRRGMAAGATKVFDKSNMQVDAIVAEIVGHLLGPRRAKLSPANPVPLEPPLGKECPDEDVDTAAPSETNAEEQPETKDEEISVTRPSATLKDFMLRPFRSMLKRKDSSIAPPPLPDVLPEVAAKNPASESEGSNEDSNPGDGELRILLPQALLKQPHPTPQVPVDDAPAPAPELNLSGQSREQLEKQLRALTQEHADLQKELVTLTKSRDNLRTLVGSAPLGSSESWVEQLQKAQSTASSAQEALQQESARAKQFEEELGTLRQTRNELNTKLAEQEKASAASQQRSSELEQRLQESKSELAKVQADLDKHMVERERSEATLRSQLEAARAVSEKTVSAFREQTTQCMSSLSEMAALRKERDELNAKAASEAEAAQESKLRSAQLEKRLRESTEELERLKRAPGGTEHVGSAASAVQKAEAAYKEEAARCGQFEKQLAKLNDAREEVNEKLSQQEKACSEAQRHSQELEKQLDARAVEIERLKNELAQHTAEHSQVETQLRQQLSQVQASTAKVGAAYEEETTFHTRSAEELLVMRQARDQLNARLEAEQQSVVQSKARIDELERRLSESAIELQGIKSDRDLQASERERLEAECRKITDVREGLDRELTRLRQTQAAQLADASGEVRGRDAVISLARITADLEQQRGERRRMEQRASTLAAQLQTLHEELRKQMEAESAYQDNIAGLERRVQELEQALARSTADLEKETTDRKWAEEQLRANQEIGAQLSQHTNVLDEARQLLAQSQKNQEDLEKRLHNSLASLQDKEAKLQKETTERKRAQETSQELKRKIEEQTQKHALELSKLQSSLQLETLDRKRLESQSMQSRHASLDAERAGRVSVNGLRNQLQGPLENIVQATRRLLEQQLSADSKGLAEAALESAFLMRSSLQKVGETQPESSESSQEAVAQTKTGASLGKPSQ